MTFFMCAQTLEALHDRAHYAHLDITSNNIMLLSASNTDEWDDIRLLDLGLAQKCAAGEFSLPDFIPDSDCHPMAAYACVAHFALLHTRFHSRIQSGSGPS